VSNDLVFNVEAESFDQYFVWPGGFVVKKYNGTATAPKQ
jgi:hypothetical protein